MQPGDKAFSLVATRHRRDVLSRRLPRFCTHLRPHRVPGWDIAEDPNASLQWFWLLVNQVTESLFVFEIGCSAIDAARSPSNA